MEETLSDKILKDRDGVMVIIADDIRKFIKELQKESYIHLGQDILVIRWSKVKEIFGGELL